MARKLPVRKVIFEAFLIPWRGRERFVEALTLPLTAIFALTISWHYGADYLSDRSSWLLYFVSSVLFVVFAVTCHRLVLIPPTAHSSKVRPHWTLREVLFLFWTGVLGLVVVVVEAVVGTVLLNFVPGVEVKPNQESFQWIMSASRILGLYLFSRLCFVLPATALGKMPSFKWAWRQTKGNGWRLFAVVTVVPWALSWVIGLLWRDTATSFETVTLTFVGTALLIVEVAALSLSFRELMPKESSVDG